MAENGTTASLLAAIVEHSDDAIVSKDLNGVVTSWNRAAERMFGYSAEEMIGRSIKTIIPPERLAEEDVVLSKIRSGESVDHFQTVRRRKDGDLIDVSLTVSPIRASNGRIVGASKIARDISGQKRLTEELEEANRVKDEFLATLSHELRTPLHSILGYTQILRQASLDDERRDSALHIIERNAKSLAQLVSDVLDVSRIVTGKIRLETRRCELGPIVTAALDSVQPTFDVKGVRLDRRLDGSPIVVMGDPARLQQVVWNLLANAVKFTPAGGRVVVTLGRTRTHAELAISDTGIGIESAFLPHLFERFRQADSRTSRHYGGLGIGLALVRHFVELHGGTVEASSDGPGQGAMFRLTLPLTAAVVEPAVRRPRSEPAPQQRSSRLGRITVLAVDDDPDSLQLLDEILTTAGAGVLCASSASAALRLLDLQRPDVIVSDVGMPGRDGYDFIRAVRQRGEPLASIPAAALTAYVRPDDRRLALEAGFQMHLSKPIDPEALIEAVEKLATAETSKS